MRKAPSDLSIFSANNRFPNALAGEAASSTSLSIDQINIALRLPVAIRGALMPDAHKGNSLLIGGVIGRRGAEPDALCNGVVAALGAGLSLHIQAGSNDRRPGQKRGDRVDAPGGSAAVQA